MSKSMLAAALLAGAMLATPVMAQQDKPTPGEVLKVEPGQGNSATGSSEMSRQPSNTVGGPNNTSMGGPTDAIGKGPHVGGSPDDQKTQLSGRATPGQALGVQPGQGNTATGSSETPAGPNNKIMETSSPRPSGR
jgi:hypothetical protein